MHGGTAPAAIPAVRFVEAEAWQNLLGMSAPLLSGGSAGRLGEAREWMTIADSALKRGDWSGFGRAFEALREILKAEE